MNLVEGYAGTFSRDQVYSVQNMLNLPNHEAACSVCEAISTAPMLMYSLLHDQRARIGPVGKAKRKLEAIAAAAKKLSDLLSDDEINLHHDEDIQQALRTSSLAFLSRKPLWGDEQLNLHDIIKIIDQIKLRSYVLASNDRLMRGYYYLHKSTEHKNMTESITIWPTLFAIWEQHGLIVAESANGPLYRFVQLVHIAAGLRAVEGEALGDAVKRWKAGPLRHRTDNSIWCYTPKE